jgi:alcohol dehydrogenase class IV
MSCAVLAMAAVGCDAAFTIDASRVTFGAGCLAEVGERARSHGCTRVALVTDRQLRALPWFDAVTASLAAAGVDVAVFDEVAIEPTDASFAAAAQFAREARVDGYVSLGGGSVIDTCKAANLFATHGAPLRTYVNAPVGDGRPVPGPLAPHLACPTTCGTGSEVTGIAIFDWVEMHAKTGIASPRLRPSEAIVDPRTTSTLPANVVAASGMDVLCHALESYTARASTRRAAPGSASARPMSQGANPWSDIGCREAIRICGEHLARAARGAEDREARMHMAWAATLAGIAFGNAGVHVPHAMAYGIAGRVRAFAPDGYPAASAPIVPHGMAVSLGAPAVFRAFARFDSERHLEAAALLGAETRDVDAGEALAGAMIALGKQIGIPNGLAGVGYTAADVPDLVAGTWPQQRLLGNAPRMIDQAAIAALFHASLAHW